MRRQEEGAKAAHKVGLGGWSPVHTHTATCSSLLQQMSQTRYTESAEASEGWEEGREDRTEGGGSEEAGRSGRGRGRRGTGSSSRSSRRGKGRGRGRGRGAQGDSTGLRKGTVSNDTCMSGSVRWWCPYCRRSTSSGLFQWSLCDQEESKTGVCVHACVHT